MVFVYVVCVDGDKPMLFYRWILCYSKNAQIIIMFFVSQIKYWNMKAFLSLEQNLKHVWNPPQKDTMYLYTPSANEIHHANPPAPQLILINVIIYERHFYTRLYLYLLV